MTRSLQGFVTAIMLVAGPAWAGEQPCSGCRLIGSLTVQLSSIEPPSPAVGETVTLRFAVSFSLRAGFSCSLDGCELVGGAPVLEGEERPFSEGNEIVVVRRAVQPGIATVQLDVTGRTEEVCFFENEFGCSEAFQYAFIEASTGPLSVEVLPAPTDTPTQTPTVTPTSTPRPVTDDDGCAIGGARRGEAPGVAWLTWPVLLLLAARVSRRAARGR